MQNKSDSFTLQKEMDPKPKEDPLEEQIKPLEKEDHPLEEQIKPLEKEDLHDQISKETVDHKENFEETEETKKRKEELTAKNKEL